MAKKENLRMKALYDYAARTPNELSFKKGQSVFLFSADDDGWASGECHGKQGWFPSSYVTPDTALNEMAIAQIEAEPASAQQNKNVDRRSLLMHKQQTSTHLNEALAKRPEREQLEQQHILTPSPAPVAAATPAAATATTAAKNPAPAAVTPTGNRPPAATALSSSDPKKKGLGGLFGFGKKKEAMSPAAASASSPQNFSSGVAAPYNNSAGTPVVTTIAGAATAPPQRLVPARYFRVTLDKLPCLKDGSRQLPAIVEACVEYIRKTALDLEGIFRISGLASEVDGLQKQFESGDYSGKLRSNDPHAVAGVLKKFFRELPEPLFTLEQHKPFLETLKIEQSQQAAVLRPLIEALPPINLRIVRFMLPFLLVVSKHKDRNMMNVQNLSIVFGPTFMRSAEENRTGVPDGTNRGAAVIENMILHCEAIFGHVEGADSSTPMQPAPPASRPPKQGGSMRAPPPTSPRPVDAEAPPPSGHTRAPSSSNPPVPSGSRIQPAPPPRANAAVTPPPAGIKPPSRAPASKAPPPQQKQVRALYDYKGDPAKGQLSFAKDELITLVSQHESGWWTGDIRGHKGYFPSTFVEST